MTKMAIPSRALRGRCECGSGAAAQPAHKRAAWRDDRLWNAVLAGEMERLFFYSLLRGAELGTHTPRPHFVRLAVHVFARGVERLAGGGVGVGVSCASPFGVRCGRRFALRQNAVPPLRLCRTIRLRGGFVARPFSVLAVVTFMQAWRLKTNLVIRALAVYHTHISPLQQCTQPPPLFTFHCIPPGLLSPRLPLPWPSRRS